MQGIEFVSSEFESMVLDSSRAHTPAKIDANGDGKITIEEAETVTALDVSGAAEIPETTKTTTKATKSTDLTLTTLEDIKHFENITTLDCSNNELTEVDLSTNTLLIDLNCSNNSIAAISISSHTAMENFDCSHNELTELDLGSNASLATVDCSNNKITDLDVTDLTNLTDGGLNCGDQTDATGEETKITVTINSEQSNILTEESSTSEKVEVTTPKPTPEPEPEPNYDTYVTINVTEPAVTTDLPSSYQVVFNGTTSTLTSGQSLNLTYDYLSSGNYDAYIYNSLTDVTMSSEYIATSTTSLSDHLYFGKDVVSVVADSSTTKSIEIAPMTRSLSIALNVTGIEVTTIKSMEVTISGLAQSWDCSGDVASGDAYSITEILTNVATTTTYSGNIITFGTNGTSQKITIKITYEDGSVKSLEGDVSSEFTTFNSDKSTAMTLSTDISTLTVDESMIDNWTQGTGGSHTID